MSYIADFHIHSKYSRGTSKDMDIDHLTLWAKLKGVSMLGTGDFTHPLWLAELKRSLEEGSDGVLRRDGIDFLLTAEVSNIYFKAGRTRKVHTMIFAPSFGVAEEIGKMLSDYGNLSSDGRPILHLECNRLAKRIFSISREALIVPSHVWTPHFGIFGANSGFDAPEECFEDETDRICALETGLSSDPAMNRRWSKLDRFALISNSDAHSPSKIGREANVFSEGIGYRDLVRALRKKGDGRFLSTIEFFPEEGKYHWDGHRACGVRLSPREAAKTRNLCPRCGKPVTVGVMHRLEALADREEGYADASRPPFMRLVPLAEIIGDALQLSPDSATVMKEYRQMIKNLGNEFRLLIEIPEKELIERCPPKIARGIINVREGKVEILPGYDGAYGEVKIARENEERAPAQPIVV